MRHPQQLQPGRSLINIGRAMCLHRAARSTSQSAVADVMSVQLPTGFKSRLKYLRTPTSFDQMQAGSCYTCARLPTQSSQHLMYKHSKGMLTQSLGQTER